VLQCLAQLSAQLKPSQQWCRGALSLQTEQRQHGGMTASRSSWLLAGAVAVGAVVSVALGAYGRIHEPTFEPISNFGFSTQLEMKAWLAAVAAGLAFIQLLTALRIYGRLGGGKASRATTITHRASGTLAVLVTLPVAYNCLWSLGFQTYSNRVLAHSLLGCLFYGVFVAKMLTLKVNGVPRWAIPVLGGTTFAVLIGVAATSSLWYFVQDSPGY
jgi:hypothetical protein